MVEGAKYLYDKINDNIKSNTNNDDNNNSINIIRLENENDVQKSSLIFEKSEEIRVEENKDNEDNNIENQEFPSLSKINKYLEDNNKNENSDVNNSDVTVELKLSTSDKDNGE